MIHPNTEVRFVSPTIGYGVFATANIPCGTIVYVKDKLETELSGLQFNEPDKPHQAIADKYSDIDAHGTRILSWDNAKFVNHRCDCNTLSTGYGFEIAVRDISEGEEICDDYGLFNLEDIIPISCNCPCCRTALRPDDFETCHAQWDKLILTALEKVKDVHQPLMQYMDTEEKRRLRAYLCGEESYTSVLALKNKRKSIVPPIPRADNLQFTP